MTNFCQEMTVNIFSYISTGKKPKSDKEDKIKQIKVFFVTISKLKKMYTISEFMIQKFPKHSEKLFQFINTFYQKD